MIFLFAALALGLAVAAYNARDRGTRVFLVVCCVLNLAGIVKVVISDDPYAFKLHPAGGDIDPPYRR